MELQMLLWLLVYKNDIIDFVNSIKYDDKIVPQDKRRSFLLVD